MYKPTFNILTNQFIFALCFLYSSTHYVCTALCRCQWLTALVLPDQRDVSVVSAGNKQREMQQRCAVKVGH